jgi:hypothetical protein
MKPEGRYMEDIQKNLGRLMNKQKKIFGILQKETIII